MGTIAITGSAGGIGRAITERLEGGGHRVVGIDLHDAEVIADLGTEPGRRAMVDAVDEACGGTLDGLVVGAGIQGSDGAAIVSVNHFGAVAALEGLRPLLERGSAPSAVAISSNSVLAQQGYPLDVVERCLAGDEAGARLAATGDGLGAYPASKLALGRWVRRHATGPEWAGAGIRLNAIAPGFIDTPFTGGMWEMVSGLDDIFPIPQGRPGTAAEVAGLVAYLLSPEAAFFCGSFLVMDGGTDAALSPDAWPRPPGPAGS